jgi:sec-independent protein translocase protein TatB
MLRAMFGMGGTEILVILIVALLFLGPDKLPEAAKQISKGIRDIKKQSRALQRTIEDDEHIGGAIRDLRSALRGEEEPIRPRPSPAKQIEAAQHPHTADAVLEADVAVAASALADAPAASDAPAGDAPAGNAPAATELPGSPHADTDFEGGSYAAAPAAAGSDAAKLTMPPTAGEADGSPAADSDASELASLVKPAPNTIARGAGTAGAASAGAPEPPERKHG